MRKLSNCTPIRTRFPLTMHNINPVLLVLLVSWFPSALTVPVNVALRKTTVTAIYTCGTFGIEKYNTILDTEKSYSERNGATCADLRPNGNPDVKKTPTHGPLKMVDGLMDTWWQSTSRNRRYHNGKGLGEMNRLLEARIAIDLQQEFLAEKIILMLGDALTPQKISVSKSLDGKTFVPWIWAVSSAPACRTFFETTFNNVPADQNATVCLGYNADGFAPADNIELDVSNIPDTLKEWTRIRYLDIKLYDMLFAFPYNQLANTFNHYAIRELLVMAECPCNGQQKDCQPSPTTGQYECVCGGNTKGRYCESCMAKFNQYQFREGVACQECNCFNHTNSCFYRASVEQSKGSIDKDGNRKGGGVCLDCQHNTAGNNCEKCTSLFYRPAGVSQRDENACIPCGCSPAGSTINPDTGVVDCVMNSDVNRTDSKVPGECFCKANVEGLKCDTCKKGFYKLDQSHEEGCIECNCLTSGTVGANAICDGNATGQCPCKPNVQGRACDECKDGFYGLSGNSLNGCTPCTCDVGGSVDQKCNKVTGQCTCRSNNINGRMCDSVDSNFFFPSSHSISDEFEDSFGTVNWMSDKQYAGFSGKGYAVAKPKDSFSVLLNTPKNSQLGGNFIVVIVYRSPTGETAGAAVNATSRSAGGAVPISLTLPACSGKWCQANSGQDMLQKMSPGPNLFAVDVTSGNILLDKIVAVPVEYTNTSSIVKSTIPAGCDFLQNTLPQSAADIELCKQALFTVSMYYLQSALPCDCNAIGSMSKACNEHGGQCDCQTGVIGRKCDTCSTDHFGFSSTGCTPCDCDSLSSSCDPTTGQCECPSNTFGRQCELCLPGTWGWNNSTGCQLCNCHPDGSAFLQCNGTSGVCTCKPGVQGDKCDECQDNFYNLGSLGCSPCGCDVGGSKSQACNKTTGQCDCKANTVGRQCNQCMKGSFGLDNTNPNGCLDCVCMGVTSQCASSTTKFSSELFALSMAASAKLQLATEDGNIFSSKIDIETGDNGLTSTLIFTYEAGQPLVYWKMPDVLVTNMLNLYNTDITTTVNYVRVNGTALTNLQAVLLTSDGKKLTASFGPVNQGFETKVKLNLRETSWKMDGVTAALNRKDFLKVLARGKALLVPATFSTGKHTSRLSLLQFNVQSNLGTVNPLVELCQCGSSYSGSSCESCAGGFRRSNTNLTEYFGECVGCECNGHSSQCDENTGDCLNCLHNTVGKSCNECALGFYGNATIGTANDCLPCPCVQPRVVNASCHSENVNGTNTVKCDFCRDGYVGDLCQNCAAAYFGNPQQPNGTCTACECNGNADSCDSVTGVCQNCRSNTVGDNCDRCADNFFGNASLQNCQACGCQPNSSNATTCDGSTGQCPCVLGVGGRTCDACLNDYWGFDVSTFVGCRACGCNAEGSVSTQCNGTTGQCNCKANTQGDLCDSCSPNFFGLPAAACQACDCHPTGSVPGTSCNSTDGQCSCQPGVGGRKCDACLPLFVNFTSSGCQECDMCQKALGTSVEELTANVTVFITSAQTVFAVQDEDTRLQNLTTQLDYSLQQLGLSGSDATSVTDVLNNITNTQNSLQAAFQATNRNILVLSTAAADLSAKSSAEVMEEQNLLNNVTDVNRRLITLGNRLAAHLQSLQEYNSSASNLAEKGKGAGTISVDLSNYTAAANVLLARVRDVKDINSVIELIKTQQVSTSMQMIELESYKDQFDNASITINRLTSELNTVAFDVAGTDNSLDEALVFKAQAEELLAAVQTILNHTEKGNTALAATIASARSAVSNTNAIYNGDARQLIKGDDALPFPNGVTNYENGKSRLEQLLSTITLTVNQVSTSVTGAEAHVRTLQSQFDALNGSFQNLPSIGKEANAAIKNYELVIEDLDSSVMMANTASTLITQVQTDLSGNALQTRQANYAAEKNSSEVLRDEMVNLDYKPEVLRSDIAAKSAQLDKEVNDWKEADDKVEAMNVAAQALNGKLENNMLVENVIAAEAKVKEAAIKSENVADSVTSQSNVLDQKEVELDTTKEQIGQVKQLDNQTRTELNDHLTAYNDFQSKLKSATDARDSGQTLTASVSQKIALLETKLARAEGLLVRLRQPRTFDGNLSLQIDNPKANTPLIHSSLSLNVKKAANFSEGNIFFTENSNSAEEFEVGFKSNQIFFEYFTSNQKVTITNPMEICNDCWAKVVASRLGTVGFLSVTKLPSGEVISSSSSSQPQSTTTTVTLTSRLFIGTLPQDTNINKVNSKTFEGCLSDVTFENQAVNLWSAAVSTNQEAKCCVAPPTTSVTTVANGASFTGYGFLVRDSEGTRFSDVETFSFEFRTFSASGNIFLLGSEDSQTLIALSLSSGFVALRTKDGNNDATVQTTTAYNTGKWVKVVLRRTANQIQLSTSFLDNPADVKTISGSMQDLNPLNNRNLIFGASSDPFTAGVTSEQASVTLLSRVDDTYFKGCLRKVEFKMTSSANVQTLALNENVVIQEAVIHGGCPQDVMSGLRLLKETAYVQLANNAGLSQLASLEITFATTEDQGVLFYASTTGGARYLYIGVFGGHVILKYQQDRSATIVSDSMFVSDGKQHTLRLDMKTSRISMNIDGVISEESSQTLTTPHLTFTNGITHAGGVPANMLSAQVFPSVKSVQGGIVSLSMNGNALLWTQSSFTVANDVSLSGVMAAAMTQSRDACATKSPPQLLPPQLGVTLDGSRSISWSTNVESGTQLTTFFNKDFVLEIEFASYKADGVLLYVANSLVSPTLYYTIYMENGIVKLKMKSSSGVEQMVQLQEKYDNGQRFNVKSMRENDFVTLQIGSTDFVNSQGSRATPTTIDIPLSVQVFVGGLGVYTATTTPFPASLRSDPNKVSFAGAIYSAKITANQQIRNLLFGALDRTAYPAVAQTVTYGVSLSGDASYLGLGTLTTSEGSTIEMKIMTTTESALLFALYKDNVYFIVDYSKHQIRVHLSPTFNGVTSPLTLTVFSLPGSSVLCDAKPHTLLFQLMANKITVTVDGVEKVSSVPASHAVRPFSGATFVVGGLPPAAPTFADVTTTRLAGCVETVKSTSGSVTTDLDPTQHAISSQGFSFGCPA